MDEGAEDGKAGDLSSNTIVLSGTMHAGQGFPWSQALRVGTHPHNCLALHSPSLRGWGH